MSKAQDRPHTSAAVEAKKLISKANITDQQASSMSEEEIVKEINKSAKRQ